MEKNKITASIVIFNSDRAELHTVITCADKSIVERIYIIDNSLTDTISEFVYALSNKVEYIHGQGNVGYGSAHNIAIRKAIDTGAHYHIVLNPDIQFKPSDIEKMADYLNLNKDIGWLMPRVVYPNGELQYLCKLLPTPMDLIGRRFLGFLKSTGEQNHKFEMRDSEYNQSMNVPFCSGCFMFLRIETLRQVGLFDDRIFMYGEDIDLSRRIHTNGWKTVFWPEVTIIHAHNKESYRSKKLLLIHIRSIIYYFNKYGWFCDRERREVNARTLSDRLAYKGGTK